MRSLIIVAVLGVCTALPQPFISYTPEVAAERARFFDFFQKASAASAPANALPSQQAVEVSPSVVVAPSAPLRWTGPVAATVPAGVNGLLEQVPDTSDVAAARNAFLASYQAQLAATGALAPTVAHAAPAPTPAVIPAPVAAPVVPVRWTGPFAATVPAGVDGTLTPVGETADVSAAKAEFLRAYQAAVSATVPAVPAAPAVPTVPAAPVAPVFAAAPTPVVEPVQPRWTGPLAAEVPAGLPGSLPLVAETPAVAAAKAAFFRVYQQAAAAAPKATTL